MKVVITEKPSVARVIAAVLKITGKKDGYIEGRGCAITWAFGHLVTLLDPGEYDPALKKWRLDSLPFIPDTFRLKLIENRGVTEQFETIGFDGHLCKPISMDKLDRSIEGAFSKIAHDTE